MFEHLRPGDSTQLALVGDAMVEQLEIRLLRRAPTSTLTEEIQRAARPRQVTDGLPQRCRWYGRADNHQTYVFEMPPRLVTWRFQLHLDPDQRVAVPVALPFQVYLLKTLMNGAFAGFSTYWRREALPCGASIYDAELHQYAAPNVRPRTGSACLGSGGVGLLPSLTGASAMLHELHRSMGEDLNGVDMSHEEILTFLPPDLVAPAPAETGDEPLFGLPASQWASSAACMRYAAQFGLWTRAQPDPLAATCQLRWPVVHTVRQALRNLAPEIMP